MTVARLALAGESLPRPDRYDVTRASGTSVRKPGKISLGWDALDKTTPFLAGLATVDSLRTAFSDHAPSTTFTDEASGTINVYWLEPPKVTHVKGTRFAVYQVDIELVEY